MKMSKNIVLLSITIVTLISLVALATYSYFTASTNINNKITTNVKMPLRPTFIVSGGGELAITVTRDLTLQENAYNGTFVEGKNIQTTNKNLIVNLSGEPGTTCTYNIYYKDTSSNSVTSNTWDFTFVLYRNGEVELGSHDFSPLFQSSAGVPKITPLFGGSTSPFDQAKPVITIPSGATLVSDNWEFSLRFVNRPWDQSLIAGKTFKGELYIDDVSCT